MDSAVRTPLLDVGLGKHLAEPRWNWSDLPGFFYRFPLWPGLAEAARTEKAIVLECWKYGEELSVPCESQIRYIDDGELESWAKQPIPTQHDKLPRAGLRLLHVCLDRDPFPKEVFIAISNILALPRVKGSTSTQTSGVCARLFNKGTNHPVFICRSPRVLPQTVVAPHNTAITTVMRYDPDSNTTVGYVLSGSASQIHHTLKNVPTQFDMCEHPLLIPVLMTELSTEVLNNVIYGIENGLNSAEAASYNYIEGSESAEPGYFRSSVQFLSDSTRAFALCKSRMQACSLRNAFLEQQLESTDTWMPTILLQSLQESTLLLKQRIAYNRSNIEHLMVASGFELRLEALKALVSVTTMAYGISFARGDKSLEKSCSRVINGTDINLQQFNLVAQEDNQVNIRLSREMRKVAIKTKIDGSTMKLVAILGTIFLPATFVSTFFSMPFFDWTAPMPTEVIGNHFWIYWAVTGPLTLLTMVLVGAWTVVRNRNISDDDDDEAPKMKLPPIDFTKHMLTQGANRYTQLEIPLCPEKGVTPYSTRLFGKFKDILASVFRLRSRQRNNGRKSMDEESHIR